LTSINIGQRRHLHELAVNRASYGYGQDVEVYRYPGVIIDVMSEAAKKAIWG
jgi:hypothetical protein